MFSPCQVTKGRENVGEGEGIVILVESTEEGGGGEQSTDGPKTPYSEDTGPKKEKLTSQSPGKRT